jgi:putative flippase GtrA
VVASAPRYLVVSGGCVVLNTLLLIGLDEAGVHYALGVVLSALVLIPLSYVLHLTVTYRTQGGLGSFGRYAAAQIVNTPVALVLMFLIHGQAGLPMTVAAPAVIGLMFLYNLTTSFWAIALRDPAKLPRKA